jgi:restriction system protein
MAIPDFQSVMLPLLRHLADGKEHKASETTEALAGEFHLTDAERRVLLPSGVQELFRNRVAWATFHLKKAGLASSPSRGNYRITERGLDALKKNPSIINLRFLSQFPEFVAFRKTHRERPELHDAPENGQSVTPEEALESAYERIRDSLAAELLQKLKACSPSFFERLVIEVIVKMGYGGTRSDAGKAVGKSGDGGIDGIIKEDKLGLDTIYIQAKRWEGTVGRPEIHRFVGALAGQRARKGLFITTSDFSDEAVKYASGIDTKIVLIDGETLADLMIDHNVGVSTVAAYELKKIDTDYFTEE